MIMTHNKLSFAFYSHDGFGLGHVRRNLNIAMEAAEQFGASNLLIMSHNSIPFLPNHPGIDFIKLPSILKVGKEEWAPRTLPVTAQILKNLRTELIKNTFNHYLPSLLVVDYMPGGVWDELLPILPLLKNKGTKLVLGLRDILDEPKSICELWKEKGIYETIQKFYDHILIYGCKEIFPSCQAYGLSNFEKKIHYTGYLASVNNLGCRDDVRKEFGFDQKPLVVLTGGGGNDAFPMMEKSLEALEIVSKEIPLQALLVAGPLMHPKERATLYTPNKNFPCRIIPHCDDLVSAMDAADLLITMGSYNTLVEAIHLKKKALVIPREGPSQEQKIRTNIFEKLGLVKGLPSPLSLTPQILAKEVKKALNDSWSPKQEINLNGRKETVKCLKKILQS
jgi:predicted glycosyltransferase